MKRCPECRRDYADETLNFCLDDGTPLVNGPRTVEPETAILAELELPDEAPTKRFIGAGAAPHSTASDPKAFSGLLRGNRIGIAVIAVLIAVGFFGFYGYRWMSDTQPGPAGVEGPKTDSKFYWEMAEAEQLALIRDRSRYVQALIGDDPAEIDEDAQQAIKIEVDDYVRRKDSLSQKQFEEGMRAIYGRATQYAPMIIQVYEKYKVPSALGVYQAMIESEYHDCPEPIAPTGPVGMFQFSRRTAAKYGLQPEDYCNVGKQADAAARHMSDLASDFGEGKGSATLGLLSYMEGAEAVRDYLRQLRRAGITERSFWAVFRNRREFEPPLQSKPPPLPLTARGLNYVPRFFAAAIIGETPDAFDLPTPPLTTLRK